MLKVVQGGPGEVVKTKPAPTAPPSSKKTVAAPATVSEHGRGGGSTSKDTGQKPTKKETQTGYATPAGKQPTSTDPTPPKKSPAPVPSGINTNTGSASAALQGYTTTGPARGGEAGSLNVPALEAGALAATPTVAGRRGPGRTPAAGGRPGTTHPHVRGIDPVIGSRTPPQPPGSVVPVAIPRSGRSTTKVLTKRTLGGSEYVVKTQGFAHIAYPHGEGRVNVTLGTDGVVVSDGRLKVADPGLRELAERFSTAVPRTVDPHGTSFPQKIGWTPSITLGTERIHLSGGTEAEVEYAATVEDGHPAIETTVSVTKRVPAKGIELTYGVRVTVERIQRKPDPPHVRIPIPHASPREVELILIIVAAMSALGATAPRGRMG